MAKKTAAELGLKQEVIEGAATDMDKLPDEFSAGPPAPYPGPYRFKTPSNLSALWEAFDADIMGANREVIKKGVQRVSLVFDKEDPLVIEAAPAGEEHEIGQPFTTRINNRERNRARKGEPTLMVSDLTYWLRAMGETTVPKTNQEFIAAACKHAGKVFGADIEWSAYCNEERQIYVDTYVDAAGQTQAAPEVMPEGVVVSQSAGTDAAGNPVKGCGKRYYQNDWKKDARGRFLPRLRCSCGASLRPFGSIRNFRG